MAANGLLVAYGESGLSTLTSAVYLQWEPLISSELAPRNINNCSTSFTKNNFQYSLA
jgi:hypothetical protein